MTMKIVLVQLLFGLCFLAVGMLMERRPSTVELTREALLDAIWQEHLTSKDMQALLGYSQSQWDKIARGEPGVRLPALDRLMELMPTGVLNRLIPKLAEINVRRYMVEGAADVRDRRSA